MGESHGCPRFFANSLSERGSSHWVPGFDFAQTSLSELFSPDVILFQAAFSTDKDETFTPRARLISKHISVWFNV
jgi:hypothetical protein